jgi:hypothetical protein
MYTLLLQSFAERNQSLRLQGWLATTEGYAATLAKEWLFAHCLLDDMLQVGLFGLATEIYGVGISAVQATEVASLQEYHQSQTRAIEGAKRFV